MRPRCVGRCLFLILWTVPLCAAALPARSAVATFTAVGPRDTLLTLPVNWVVLDSVHVWRNGEFMSEYVDWRIAEPGNRIWVYRPLTPGDTVLVEYAYRPVPLFHTYLRHTLQEIYRESPGAALKDTARVVTAAAHEEPTESWTRLNKSGSLIRSVQVGTGQDLEFQSALNLQIQGRVGKNVDVVAALTDQSTPIQPEGTTETISELEKVFVSVRTPHLATTLGDYSLSLPGGQYDGYERKLTGALAEASYFGVQATAGGAVSRGEFFTNSFSGQEANQGPYALHGRTGQVGMVVLAGTEKVWLDGELMRRGEGNDYTIDYSSGEITFTAKRVITSDSRIVTDFEYATEEYERFYGAGRVQGAFGDDRLGGAVTFLSESDDRTRPIGLGLTDADREILKRAGDRPDSAVAFTADSVGADSGDYVRRDTVYNDTSFSIFVFSPRDSSYRPTGSWRVTFDDFGLGHGDYEAAADPLGLTYFRWIGPSRGRYRPYRRLALPRSQSLGDVRVQTSPLRGLNASAEMALSRRDLNTFSDRDDADNDGAAYALATRFSRETLSLPWLSLHHVAADARLRHRDRRFAELSRVSEVEFSREWDDSLRTDREETIREANLEFGPVQPLKLTGGYGDLRRPGEFSSRRRTLGASLSFGQRTNLSASHLDLKSEDRSVGRRGDWIRQNANLSAAIGRFRPSVGVEHERKKDRFANLFGGFRYTDYKGGLEVAVSDRLNLNSEYQQRLDDRVTSEGSYSRLANAYTVSGQAAWTPGESGRTLIRYAHREKDYAVPDSADVRTDVGRLESLITPRSRLFEGNIVYEVAKTRSQEQILVAAQVTPGTGNYRREGDRYIPDDQGDYVLVPRYTGNYEPATGLSLNALFWLRPDELPAGSVDPWLHALSAETELTLDEKTRRALDARLLLLDQSVFRGDSTLSGNVSIRQDLHWQRLSQKLAMRLRYRESQSLQNQYLNGGQSRVFREGGLRARARYARFWRGESETLLSREVLRYRIGSLPDRDIDRFELSQVNAITLSDRWECGLDGNFSHARDGRTRSRVSLFELRPHATFNVLGKGRFDADLQWIHAVSNQPVVPYELGTGSNRGQNLRWSVRGTYQFGAMFSGSLNYTGRQDAGEKTYHTGRLEVRASF